MRASAAQNGRACRGSVARILLAAVVLLAGQLACGKRGDPMPPLPRTPQAVGGFTVVQRGDVLEVAMVAPRMTTGGERLGVLDLELLRVDGAGEIDKGRKERFRAAPGERIVETYPLPPPGTAVKLAARALHRGQISAMGKTVTFTVQPPPPPPPSLTADLRPTGVLLTWTLPPLPSPPPAAPAASPAPSAPPSPTVSPSPGTPSPAPAASPGAAPSPAPPSPKPPAPPRVRMYRRAPGGELAPVTPEPLAGTTFEDTTAAPDQTWCYVARLVTSTDPLVESAGSREACVEVKDVFPPAAPTGLAALLQDAAVEVSWSPSPDADLASYRLYRASAGGPPQRVAEVASGTTSVRDDPPAGALHVYTLTAVDKRGNESPPSAPAEVRRP